MGSGGTEGGHDHRVLLVDDVDDTREAISYILQHAGFEVATAWGGEDALRQLREGFRPCVAVLDLRMPGLDGWQVWSRMRSDPDPEIATTAVVIMSGDGEQRERALALGMCDFLTKPIDFDALIGAVERHCTRRPR